MLKPKWVIPISCLLLASCGGAPEIRYDGPTSDWLDFGGTKGGVQYAPLTQIDRENVEFLEVAWEYHTGDVSDGKGVVRSTTAFEATPIVVGGTMYLCSPFNRVIALDPETGAERWSYDPEVDLSGRYATNCLDGGLREDRFHAVAKPTRGGEALAGKIQVLTPSSYKAASRASKPADGSACSFGLSTPCGTTSDLSGGLTPAKESPQSMTSSATS